MTNLEQLEQQLIESKTLNDARQMAIRLRQNPDFKKLILDGFCLTEAARFVQVSGDPAISAEERADALAMAQASGHFKRFLSVTIQMGAHAERTMPELEMAIEEERAGGGE